VQTQFTLFGEDVQVVRQGKPPDDDGFGLERIGPILHRLFKEWDGCRSRRARLETVMTGPYDHDLSLAADACLADEEAVADDITATLSTLEGAHE
jgi:hypothetical protein